MTSQSLSIPQTLQLALQQHQAGRLQQAENLYQQVLKFDPDNADANHLLGLLAFQAGRNEIAAQLISKAIEKNNNQSSYFNNLGNALKELKKLTEAADAFRQALSLKPNYAEAHNNLGVIFKEQGKLDDAAESFNRAISIKPDYVDAHYNLGNVFHDQGNFDEAVHAYRKALSIKPDYPEIHNNLGAVLKAHNKLNDAVLAYRKALSIKPDYPEALNNLGETFKIKGKLKDAEELYRKALSIKPDYADAYCNLGVVLKDLLEQEDSIASFRKALSIKPDSNVSHSNLLYSLHYLQNVSQKDIFIESLQWDKQQTRALLKEKPNYQNDKTTGRRLRVGYVSPDFRTHSVNYFFEPLLQSHNSEQVEIFCYSNVSNPDHITERLIKGADHWSSIVGKKDEDVVQEIQKDRIDILVDLAGHTGWNRLKVFGYKPAPVQVTWLGYPNTTGMQAIDYRFTDGITDPVGEGDNLHSEELIRLPHAFFCFQPTADAPAVEVSPVNKTGRVTFGSVNNLVKINDKVIAVWSEILNSLVDSHLLIIGREFSEKSVKKHFVELFSSYGIEKDRIEMISSVPHSEFLAIHNRIDVALDPFPYNGQTATCHTLWMGVPVITLRGNHHVARVGASILTNIGLPELIAEKKEEYVIKAIRLAKDSERLSALRCEMRDRMRNSPLCDAKAFAKAVEEAYCSIWSRWCDGRGLYK